MLFKKVDQISNEVISPGLELFSIPATDITATKSQYVEYLTLNPPSENPLTFKINGTSSFIDLNKCYLHTIMHIEKRRDETWIPLAVEDAPNLINGCGITVFENIKISIQQREVFNSNRLQAYKSYLDMILSYNHDAVNTHLQAGGFYDEKVIDDHTDLAFIERRGLFSRSHMADFVSRIYTDIFMTDKFLLNNLDLEIELSVRNYDNFCLQKPAGDANEYRFIIDSCRLFVKTVDVNDSLALTISKTLGTQTARYPIRRSILKSQAINAGLREFNCCLFPEQTPRRITLALVNHRSFTGQNYSSPFLFENGNIYSINITGGPTQLPYSSYSLDFNHGRYIRAYHDLMQNTGFAFTNSSSTISRSKFANGFTVFVFNLSSNLEDQSNFELIKNNATNLNIKFRDDVPNHGFQLIIYAEFDGIISIDSGRNVATDIGV